MDEKQKILRDFEKERKEDEAALLALLAGLGETLLERETNTGDAGGERARLLKAIDDLNARIAEIEEKQARARELSEAITLKEKDKAALLRDLDESYAVLGRALFAESGGAGGELDAVLRPFKAQLDSLLPKIRGQKDKIDDIAESARDANFFVKIGKGAQRLAAQGALGRSQNALEKVYRAAGEAYFAAPETVPLAGAEASAAASSSGGLRARVSAAGEQILKASGDKKAIEDDIGKGLGPGSRIKEAKKAIDAREKELVSLYQCFGARAADPESKEHALVKKGDKAALAGIEAAHEKINADEAKIDKLRASIGIDTERAALERLRKNIARAKSEIGAHEEDIAAMEAEAAKRNARIAELAERL
ncbi:MAG: hypothetical protein LBR16_08365 [Treponema sp.]|jgi:hypothetical protein|nr:hypothetical protein [Treponema sp.]